MVRNSGDERDVVREMFGAWLREQAQRRGVEIQALAEAIGVSKSLMSHTLSGRRGIKPEDVGPLARVLGVEVIQIAERAFPQFVDALRLGFEVGAGEGEGEVLSAALEQRRTTVPVLGAIDGQGDLETGGHWAGLVEALPGGLEGGDGRWEGELRAILIVGAGGCWSPWRGWSAFVRWVPAPADLQAIKEVDGRLALVETGEWSGIRIVHHIGFDRRPLRLTFVNHEPDEGPGAAGIPDAIHPVVGLIG